MTPTSPGKASSEMSSASLSCASRNLCLSSPQGYPPYRNDGSRMGQRVKAASMPQAKILQPVWSWR